MKSFIIVAGSQYYILESPRKQAHLSEFRRHTDRRVAFLSHSVVVHASFSFCHDTTISMHEKTQQRRKRKRPNKIKPAKHKQATSILEENKNNNNKNQNLWQVGTVDDSRSQQTTKKLGMMSQTSERTRRTRFAREAKRRTKDAQYKNVMRPLKPMGNSENNLNDG
jgi:hypothetical protein